MGGALLVYSVDRPVEDWVRGHQRSLLLRVLRPFRERSPLVRFGTAGPILLGSAGLYAAALAFHERALREAGLGCAAGVAAGSLGHGDWDHRSFFGGHAANLMTCSTFLATRFSLGPGEPVLYAAALRVALGRVADLAHWPSDTFVGLVVGYATGRLEALRVADRRAAAVPAPATRLEAGFPRSPLPLDGVRVTTGRDGGIAIVLGRRF